MSAILLSTYNDRNCVDYNFNFIHIFNYNYNLKYSDKHFRYVFIVIDSNCVQCTFFKAYTYSIDDR